MNAPLPKIAAIMSHGHRLADLQRAFSSACRRLDAIQEEEDASEERELTEGEMQARSDYYRWGV